MKRWRLFTRQHSKNRSTDQPEGRRTSTQSEPITLEAGRPWPQNAPPTALPLFTRTHNQALAHCDELASTLLTELAQADLEMLVALCDTASYHLGALTSARFAIEQATGETSLTPEEAEPSCPQYALSTWFLDRSHAFLTGHPAGKERMHLVAGVSLTPTRRSLDHLVTVAHDSQSVVHAQADQQALQVVLAEMEAWGHVLTGLFHSHPGTGAGMSRPSRPDLDTQERYEAGRYPLVSGICTRDGWFRFFAHHPFTINLLGTGVTQYEDHLFKIQSPTRQL